MNINPMQLGKEDFPITPSPTCELARTQSDPRSSIRACMCTQDFCNIVPDGELTPPVVVRLYCAFDIFFFVKKT